MPSGFNASLFCHLSPGIVHFPYVTTSNPEIHTTLQTRTDTDLQRHFHRLHMSDVLCEMTDLHNLISFAHTSQRFDITQSVPRCGGRDIAIVIENIIRRL